MTSTPEHAAKAARIREAIRSGTIASASQATLLEYSAWLCEESVMDAINNSAVFEQSCELVRLHMLRAMMESFEKRSKIQQYAVLVFAVLAIGATLLPYLVPVPQAPQSAGNLTAPSVTALSAKSSVGKAPGTLAAQAVAPPGSSAASK
jgi:hypothetical protein